MRGAKNATCKDYGYTGDYYCKTCGELVTPGETIEKLPHQGGIATCVQGKICTVCRAEYGEVDVNNHVETELRNKVTASCTEDGYSGDVYCKLCNALVEQGVTDKKATGHNYKGVVTTEPTYDEEGVMTYTCIICQDTYIEAIAKRPVDVPFCKGNAKIRGWDAIAEYASQVRPEEVVTVDMNGAVTVPVDMLRAIRGRDVAVKFEMSDGVAWTIGGKFITETPETDVDLRIWMDGNDIPADAIETTAEGKMHVTMRFAMDGAFGFDTTINVDFNNFGGLIANVFKYDATTGALTYVGCERVTRNGVAAISVNEARDYVIIISENSMEPKKPEEQKPEVQDPEEQKPEVQDPEEQKPEEQKPGTETPSTEKPNTETPSTEASSTEKPNTETPSTEASSTEKPNTEVPSTEAPSTETPSTQAPAADVPSTQTPSSQAPSSQKQAYVTYQSTNTSSTSGNASTTEDIEEEKTTEEKIEKEKSTEEVTEAEVEVDETVVIEDNETPLAEGTKDKKHGRIWLKIVICLIAIAAAMGLGLILWAKRRDRLY